MSTVEEAVATHLVGCGDVSVAYSGSRATVHALDGVDFHVAPGEAVAVRGRSGSGKTTLLHVLGGLVTPTSGTVEWGLGYEPSAAFVFQGANLLPHFTALENVEFADRCARAAGAPARGYTPSQLLELVGLSGHEAQMPSELSGGEAQRVAMARALAQRPLLLLCDEPTGHLDSDTGARVLDLLDALHAELEFAMVTATHDPSVASRAAREVALEDGRLVGLGG